MIDARSLRGVEAFSDLSDADLRWLSAVARPIELQTGDALAEEGQAIDDLFVILEGEIHLIRESGPPDDRWIVRGPGQIAGNLPLSRMVRSPVALRALVPSRVAAFSSERVAEMLDRIPVMHARLAAVMLDRSREFARLDEQSERLQSLGKLSAGLAHELNNPASALLRRLDELSDHLGALSELAVHGLGHDVGADRLPSLGQLAKASRATTAEHPDVLDPLERSDAQESLRVWLEARGVANAWLAAETLASEGVTVDSLEEAIGEVPDAGARMAARWLTADLAARRVLDDMTETTERIVDLIAAVKGYSNQDRAPAKEPIDLNQGLRSTLTMLAHKLRHKGLAQDVELAPSLPRVHGNAGDLNQVWTNLIDNAIDASPVGATLTVRSAPGVDGVRVRICDAGPGIPSDVRPHIFEPFFTTKGVGEGSGIGLDIVHRIVHAHGGEIRVESEPGRTCFEVRLPASPTP